MESSPKMGAMLPQYTPMGVGKAAGPPKSRWHTVALLVLVVTITLVIQVPFLPRSSYQAEDGSPDGPLTSGQVIEVQQASSHPVMLQQKQIPAGNQTVLEHDAAHPPPEEAARKPYGATNTAPPVAKHASRAPTLDLMNSERRKDFVLPAPNPNNETAKEALDFLGRFAPGDRELTVRMVRRRLQAFKDYLRSSEELRHRWNGDLAAARPRGIIMSAGGSRPLMNAFIVLYVLRHALKCRLPVVLAHFGRQEFSNATQAFFMEHIPDVEFLNVGTSLKEWPKHHIYLDSFGSEPRDVGYKIKVWSLYKAPFREVLFLDADSTPVQDPALLFETAEFRQHGSLFWPDFWRDPVRLYRALAIEPDPWVAAGAIDPPQDINKLTISLVGFNEKPPPAPKPSSMARKPDRFDALSGTGDQQDPSQAQEENGNERSTASAPGPQLNSDTSDEEGEALFRMQWPYQAESGQIYLNRTKHWLALEYALFLNTHDSLTYKHSMGDKDTFRAAFALAGVPEDYWQCPFSPSLPLHDRGLQYDADDIRFWNMGMLQLHPVTGDPMFHHRTADSKFEPGVRPRANMGPITHVTPSTTPGQAGAMIWGDPEATLYTSGGQQVQWGLAEDQVRVFPCTKPAAHDVGTEVGGKGVVSPAVTVGEENRHQICTCLPVALHEADARCAKRSRLQQELEPEPISAIQVPQDSAIYRVSLAEAAAYKLIPMQEASQH